MIAFEVKINGNKKIIAGQDDLSVLSASITAVGQLGSKTTHKKGTPEIGISVGGLEETNNTHPFWTRDTLNIGDVINIKIIETDNPDKPETSLEQIKSEQVETD